MLYLNFLWLIIWVMVSLLEGCQGHLWAFHTETDQMATSFSEEAALSRMTWHIRLQHCLCCFPHHLEWGSGFPAHTSTLQALCITPKHWVFHAAQLHEEKEEDPDLIPDGTLASKMPCEMYVKIALRFTAASRHLIPRKALQKKTRLSWA